jgi:MYXO-CTERM domain-containing protein
MDITTLVFSNAGRAIPENYNHVKLNLAAIDWISRGSNYRDVVARAADEGSGNAFTTEFSGPADIFRGQIDPGFDLSQLERAEDVNTLIGATSNRNLGTMSEVAGILLEAIGSENLSNAGITEDQFLQCPLCFQGRFPNIPVDGMAAADAIRERVTEPLTELQSLADRFSDVTRLYTLISPEEMNLDPIFSYRDDLPDVSNVHQATIVRDCGVGGTTSDANIEVIIEETGDVLRFASLSDYDRSILDQGPAAVLVEQLAQGIVVKDQSDDVARAIEDHNGCSCSAAETRSSVRPSVGLLALVGLALGLRRRRG